ncbi:hypothetical protein N180_19485 [Pedobacter antarcticus 4BY]|uniref:DUF4833 domain-containing protein n=3 Tax=Pedobacter antarcticus TaxID=34086 RepID=A0A081PG23_9SPHI|nr:hypothetical protein N180_19485 [Pedobacter antarcticus 4BY]SFF00302.1 protein of unknown function [Pedobacter antarcticus]
MPSALKNSFFQFFIAIFLIGGGFNASAQDTGNPSPLNFPVPKGIENQLFYLQRDPNINTIICELNVGSDGDVIKDKPVSVYWIRYDEKKEKKDLNMIQRKFAYGIDSKEIGKDKYELRFVSHKKLPMYLQRSATDKKFHVYVTVNQKKIQVERIFLRIEGGSFWLPNVKYVEIKGIDTTDSLPTIQRIKI